MFTIKTITEIRHVGYENEMDNKVKNKYGVDVKSFLIRQLLRQISLQLDAFDSPLSNHSSKY